jgi:hypothetical protein
MNSTYVLTYSRPAGTSPGLKCFAVMTSSKCLRTPSSTQRPQEEATEASEELLEGGMPPAAYRLMHAHARRGTADRDRLAQGLAKTLGGFPPHDADRRER